MRYRDLIDVRHPRLLPHHRETAAWLRDAITTDPTYENSIVVRRPDAADASKTTEWRIQIWLIVSSRKRQLHPDARPVATVGTERLTFALTRRENVSIKKMIDRLIAHDIWPSAVIVDVMEERRGFVQAFFKFHENDDPGPAAVDAALSDLTHHRAERDHPYWPNTIGIKIERPQFPGRGGEE